MLEDKIYFKTKNGVLYKGNALEILKELPENSVDVIITSPPYFSKRVYPDETVSIYGGDPNCDHEWVDIELGLQHENRNNLRGKQEEVHGKRKTTWIRKYDKTYGKICKKCGAYLGQLGLEPTPEMFVEHLVEIFDEVKRVLKPTGSLFVNIDDTWIGGGRGYGLGKDNDRKWKGRNNVPKVNWNLVTPKRKSLALVPELFAIKMVYDSGWILREKIIWAKKVLFYKENRTYGNAMPEPVRDRLAHSFEFIYHFTKSQKYYFNWEAVAPPLNENTNKRLQYSWNFNEKTKSDEYVRITKEINKQLQERANNTYKVRPNDVVLITLKPFKGAHFATFPVDLPEFLIKVACPDGGVVLDPFAGSGTTLYVAEQLGCKWIGIEPVGEYCELIKKRFEEEPKKKFKKRKKKKR